MLGKLPEPTSTIVATAAFAGLREAELRGLQMEDFDGKFIHVRRSVWRTNVNETKTDASESVVPVIRPLEKVLEEHKRREGRTTGWMFQGDKKKFSLNLDNLVKRNIRPTLNGTWLGWHALRLRMCRPARIGLDDSLAKPGRYTQISIPFESVQLVRLEGECNRDITSAMG